MYNKSLDPCLAAWPSLPWPSLAWPGRQGEQPQKGWLPPLPPPPAISYLLRLGTQLPAMATTTLTSVGNTFCLHVKMSPSFELNLKHFVVVVVVVGPPLNWVLFLSSKRCHTWHTYVSKYSNVHKYIYNTYVCVADTLPSLTPSITCGIPL